MERIASKMGEILLENGARGTQSSSKRRNEEAAEGQLFVSISMVRIMPSVE